MFILLHLIETPYKYLCVTLDMFYSNVNVYFLILFVINAQALVYAAMTN